MHKLCFRDGVAYVQVGRFGDPFVRAILKVDGAEISQLASLEHYIVVHV